MVEVTKLGARCQNTEMVYKGERTWVGLWFRIGANGKCCLCTVMFTEPEPD